MTLSRDSLAWTLGLIGAVVTAVAMQVDQFTWFSEDAKHWITLASVIVAAISGKLATSPLPSKQAASVANAAATAVDAERALMQASERVDVPMQMTPKDAA